MNDFSWALQQLKEGKAITRGAWKGKNWIVSGQFPDENSKMKQPYLFMSHEGGMVPWAPQQFDLFARDYELVVDPVDVEPGTDEPKPE